MTLNNELNESLKIARQKAAELNLPIKIIKGIREKEGEMTFYFESENRVDFRLLVQELNNFFKESIRLEQIGSRDVVKKIGGFGVCGREVCCKRFLPSFQSITNDMIVAQGLKCSPAQCTGMCGKLVCCLSYECPKEKLLAIQKTKKQNKVKLAQKKVEAGKEMKEIKKELPMIQIPAKIIQKVEVQKTPNLIKTAEMSIQNEKVVSTNVVQNTEPANEFKPNTKHFKKKKNKPQIANKKIKTKLSKLVRIVRK